MHVHQRRRQVAQPDASPTRKRLHWPAGVRFCCCSWSQTEGCRRRLADHFRPTASCQHPKGHHGSSTSTNSIPSTSSSVSRSRSRPVPVACAGLRPAYRKAFISIFSLFCNKLLSTTISKKKKTTTKIQQQNKQNLLSSNRAMYTSVTKNDREEQESAPLHAPLRLGGRQVLEVRTRHWILTFRSAWWEGRHANGGFTRTRVCGLYGKKCNRSNIEACNRTNVF